VTRTLLFVSGGIEAVPAIARAKQMGLRVVVSDGAAEAPGMALADERLVVSTYDVAGTVAAARGLGLDGVICVASDVPQTVAGVAEAFGLPGVTPESATLATDKLAMKERFARDGVPIPWFAPVGSSAELAAIEGPLILKPVDSRGARGVIRMTAGLDPEWAFTAARTESPTGRVMAERFLDGPQVSTESLVIDGVAHTVGLADRNYEHLERFAPYVIEDGGELPTRHAADAIAAVVQQAATSLGVRDGIVKGDIVIHDGRPHVIELAARLSGGYLCTHEIPLSTGVDFVGCAIRVALGEAPDAAELVPRSARGVAQRWLFPPAGRVVAISGADDVGARPEIELCELRVAVGDTVPPVTSHPSRAGVVIATGPTREQAIAAARSAVEAITIATQ
jgi:biotin carboxylase